jgi:rod shape-determining protein MreD
MKVLQVNLLITSIVSLIGVALLEIAVFEMNTLIGITAIDFTSFLKMRLIPTLLLNAIFLIIAAYPLKRHFEKFAENLRAD